MLLYLGSTATLKQVLFLLVLKLMVVMMLVFGLQVIKFFFIILNIKAGNVLVDHKSISMADNLCYHNLRCGQIPHPGESGMCCNYPLYCN